MTPEGQPKIEMNADRFEELLKVRLADIGEEELKKTKFMVFSVTPGLAIFISKVSHEVLSNQFGVDLDRTYTEGYVTLSDGGQHEIIFKTDEYQPARGFQGTDEEFGSLKLAVKRKLENLLK